MSDHMRSLSGRDSNMTHVITIMVASALLLQILPVIGAQNGREPGYRGDDRLWIQVLSSPRAGPDGQLHLDRVSVDVQGSAILGFSDGSPFEIVIDPTPGAPEVPWIAFQLQVRGRVQGLEVRSSDIDELPYPGCLRTVPSPTNPWETEEPWGVWEGKKAYPNEPLLVESIGYRRISGELFNVYSIWFCPFKLAGGGALSHTSTTGIVLTTLPDATGPTPSKTTGDPGSIPGTLSITEHLSIHPEYLIITGEELVDDLDVLARWRNRMGIATSVVSIDDILGEYSGSSDPADLLRSYIRDVLDTWGSLEYVLLAGDWDTVPVKRVYDSDAYPGWDDGRIPADSYYQCLDGSWDLDGDGSFAEPGDLEDIIPDLTVSRLAINDERTWNLKIDQIISYEEGGLDSRWKQHALLVAANTHNPGDGNTHSEYLWEKYLKYSYTDRTTLYEDEGSLSLTALDEGISSGASFVQFVDHGGPTVWCDDYGAGVVYRDRDASSLDNSPMLPVVSTLACLTAWFDDTSGCSAQRFSECLGEAFTENVNGGALGYIGSSRTSVGILGANRYLPYDNGLQEDYARQLGSMKEFTLGTSFTRAKEHYSEVWGGQFSNPNNAEVSLCWLEYTLLGEPACEIWTSDLGSMDVHVEHEDDLDPHIAISVLNEDGAPLPGVNITLQNFERGIFERGVTDIEGEISFDLALDWFCDINLTATKHDHLPSRDFIRISDVIPPETSLISDPPVPEGENGWFLSNASIRLVPNERGNVHYRIGNGPYSTLNSTLNYSLPSLVEGINELHYFGEDEAGNLESERHALVRIDLNTPAVSIDISPSEPDGFNGWYTTEPFITLGLEGVDTGSPVTLYYELNGEGMTYNEPFFIPQGEYALDVWGEDEAGRTSARTSLELRVDTVPPEVLGGIRPEDPGGLDGWYIRTPVLDLLASEPGSRIEYRLSSREPFRNYTGSLDLPDGEYMIQYRAIDGSGNIGETVSRALKIDTSPPTVICNIHPDEPDGRMGYYITTPSVRLDEQDNLGSDLKFRLDGAEWEDRIPRLEIPDGSHVLEFFSVDRAGNRCPVKEKEFLVDTEYPVTALEARGAKSGDWFTSSPLIELSSDQGTEIRYTWDISRGYQIYYRPLDFPEKEGIFRLFYFSVDHAGNQEDERIETIRVDTRNPILRVEMMDRGHGSYLVDCSGSTDGTDLRFRILDGSTVIQEWTGDDIVEISLGEGDHILTIESRDEAGNTASTEIEIRVRPEWLMPFLYGAPVLMLAVLIAIFLFIRSRGRRRMDMPHGAYSTEPIDRPPNGPLMNEREIQ